MLLKEVKKLNTGDFINHSRYGICRVKENKFCFTSWFGLVICPITIEGMALLHSDSGVLCNRVLEHSLRKIKSKVGYFKKPQFVYSLDQENYGLYEWKQGLEGQVKDDGTYDFEKIKDFTSRKEAMDYKEHIRKAFKNEE